MTATQWEMGREHHLLSTYYALSTELDTFLILSFILTLILETWCIMPSLQRRKLRTRGMKRESSIPWHG